MLLGRQIVCKACMPLYATLLAITVVVVSGSAVVAQTVVSPDELTAVRTAYYEQHRPTADAPLPVRSPLAYLGTATPTNAVLRGPGAGRALVDLYNGLPVGESYWFWTGAPFSFWALDDGTMGPAAVAVGGGEITAYEFAFGLHADAAGDTLEPIIFISFWNAPLDPIGDASDPVVDLAGFVSAVAVSFAPIELPAAGDYVFTSGLLDLAAVGLEFDLDETFYVEIYPAKLQGGSPVIDPNVFAVFSSGPIILGTNQDNMWIDVWPWGDLDGYYADPGELDPGGGPGSEDQSPIYLVGNECPGATLELSINEPDDICVKPGEPVTVTLSQSCLPGLVRGYQAFLSFDTADLTFGSGSYIVPDPYGLPVITPIAAVGGDIDLAAGIDDPSGQPLTSSTADLVTLNFTAGTTEGLTQVAFRSHQPPTRFSNEFGIEVVPTLVDSPTICIDGTPPTINCPPLAYQCISDVPSPAADLAEFIAMGGSASDTGCGGWVVVTHEGDSVSGIGCTADPYIVLRTYRATDCAGNFADCTQTITVIDDTPPVVTDCPDPIVVTPDAGECEVEVTWAAPTVTDNCDPAPTVEYLIDLDNDGGVEQTITVTVFTFPVGTHNVTVKATDACGNVNQMCSFLVTVNAFNELVVSVELRGLSGFNGSRCITFELWDCGAPIYGPVEVKQVLTFNSGLATGALIEVPCDVYTCITARDTLHTLRRTLDTTDGFAISGTQYVADFVAVGKDLIGGNLNDDFWVDILDFGVFSSQWGASYGSPMTGDTTCITAPPHADISGDGWVWSVDFGFISYNFLMEHEANCCEALGLHGGEEGGDGPITEISVRELRGLGLDHLAAADLNADGMLDEAEIEEFMMVARPKPPQKTQREIRHGDVSPVQMRR